MDCYMTLGKYEAINKSKKNSSLIFVYYDSSGLKSRRHCARPVRNIQKFDLIVRIQYQNIKA
ncbi:unnamed protein product [Ceutorhynchus assimilis]|uniref:Uncharacterized protein n=1 Tax=Ceutorhynchus assimilis TaxID=467358 RepID=A0A9N9QM79_9CUCU|nr:unnamed protein product [Ceutorhynchus assimilis]